MKVKKTINPQKKALCKTDVSDVKRKVCEQHQYEYYGFPIASKRCKICGYEKM